MGPIDGSEAHGAGFARGVDGAAREVERAQLATGLTDGVHLSVCCWVVVDGYAVTAACDDGSVLHDDGSEGTTSSTHTRIGQLDGFAHKNPVLFCDVKHNTYILTF